MARHRTRLHYKKLVDKIIHWLNADIDEINEVTAQRSIKNNSK